MCDEKKSTYRRSPRVMSRPPSRLSVSSANSRTRLAKSKPTAMTYSAASVTGPGDNRRGALAAVSKLGRGARRAAYELAEPQLEHQQAPEVGGAIDAAGEVIVDQRADRLGTEIAPRERSRRQHRVFQN